ncbi:hypothetical protein [Parapedobacter tibetensis]|uniref:hypothetical protein n=1 Tax=Parapedobacter tibetensis TaxID=2972951 RepID=UPI00214D8019|nr:hypothetical protein [Parapedobacter tibetensis]
MDNVFSLERFALLMRRHFSLYFRTYVMGALVLAGGTVLLFSLLAWLASGRSGGVSAGNQITVYLLVMYGGLILFTGAVLQPYQRPREATFNLLLPASKFEKYALTWLLSLVFYSICANGIYFIVRFLMVQYWEGQGLAAESLWSYDRLLVKSATDFTPLHMFIVVYLLVHACGLLGSIVFRKHAVLKTALALFVLVMLYRYINALLFKAWHMPNVEVTQPPLLPFLPAYIQHQGISQGVGLDSGPYWAFGFCSVFIVSLWFVAYLKLREREV